LTAVHQAMMREHPEVYSSQANVQLRVSKLREQIAADVRAAIASDPTIATKLESTGQIVDVRGPNEFAAGIKELNEQLAGIAKVLGMKAAQ